MNNGVECDTIDTDGMTPLIRAVWSDNRTAIIGLLENGSAPNFTVKMNQSPLQKAISSSNLDSF